jgi:hypothetical protein
VIIIEPLGGLANRMRVIASAIWLKEQLKTGLTVIWNENFELNCPYSALFEDHGMFLIRPKARKYHYIKTTNQNTLPGKIKSSLINRLIGIDYCIKEQDFHDLIWTGKLDIYEIAKRHRTVYIQTCQEFGDNAFAFRHFTPALPIIQKINVITQNFTRHTIGVHIRRLDNTNSIQFSPTPLFIQKMKAELAAEADVKFFLCTDDPKEEKAIIAEFGEKVITYKKHLDRQTVRGMQDAAIDLFCLSKTQKILGSFWSSYSDIAARINNIELNVIKDQRISPIP